MLNLHQVRQGKLELSVSEIEARRFLEVVKRLFVFFQIYEKIEHGSSVNKHEVGLGMTKILLNTT